MSSLPKGTKRSDGKAAPGWGRPFCVCMTFGRSGGELLPQLKICPGTVGMHILIALHDQSGFLAQIQEGIIHQSLQALAANPDVLSGGAAVGPQKLIIRRLRNGGNMVDAGAVLLQPLLERRVGNGLDELQLNAVGVEKGELDRKSVV